MADYNEQIDEFAPATPDAIQPEPPAVQPVPPEPVQAAPVQSTHENPYDTIIKEQTEQINALIAHNESLTAQINALIKNGAQIQQSQPIVGNPIGALNTASLASDEDWSLEALAKDIGKKPKH